MFPEEGDRKYVLKKGGTRRNEKPYWRKKKMRKESYVYGRG